MKKFKPEDFYFNPQKIYESKSNSSFIGDTGNTGENEDRETFASVCLCYTQVNCAGTAICTKNPNTDCCDMTRANACVEPLSPKCPITSDYDCLVATRDCDLSFNLDCIISKDCDLTVDKCIITDK